MKIERNASLNGLNTFGVECIAENLITIDSPEDLPALKGENKFLSSDQLILGGGSNILFTKPRINQVFLIAIPGITITDIDSSHACLEAGAGETWDDLVQFAIDNSLFGIENLSIIPGKAGAAPIQNIGAYGVELSEVFESLRAFNVTTGDMEEFKARDCQFGYRNSIFKSDAKGKYIICSITLKLSKNPEVNLSYGAFKELRDRSSLGKITPSDVRKEVIKIRNSKLPNPKEIGNAGSFFKNPVIDTAIYEALKSRFSELPGFAQNDGQTKVPAGWLIEQCGWKGKRIGNVGVHEKQALVIVNHGNANGKEVFDLAMQIQSTVLSEFGIILEPEVNVI